MSLTISVNQPNLPEGEPVYINGLGLFENGSPPRQLTDEELQNWEIHNPGVDLAEANFYGIAVSDPKRRAADEAALHEAEKLAEADAKKVAPKKTEKTGEVS